MGDYRMNESDDYEALASSNGRNWAIAGIVCGVLAILGLSVVFGPAGIILGIVARRKGAGKISTIAIIVSIVGLVIGIALGIFFASMLA